MACENIQQIPIFTSICENFKHKRPHSSRENTSNKELNVAQNVSNVLNIKQNRPRSATTLGIMENGIKEHGDKTDYENRRQLVKRAKTTSARRWVIAADDFRHDVESKKTLENMSRLRQVFINTRKNVAALRRYERESQRERYTQLKHDKSGVSTRRCSADPEMIHRKRTARVRKSRESTCVSRDTTATARRKAARRRFTRVIRLLMTVLRTMKIIVAISDALTTRTAIEFQWHTLNTSPEARKLTFNPASYAQCRIYAKLPKWAKRIVEKEPEVRTDAECRRIHALLRGLRSFDKFTERIQLAMCRAATYFRVDEARVILRRGHIGQQFYFIYSGSVFVNVEEENTQGEKFVKTECVLSKGDSFGELALLKDVHRTATITCRETCELLGVDKEVFSQICPQIFEIELAEKVNFVSRLPLFHSKYWTQSALHSLCFESQIQEYKTNKVVAADSTKEEWMYICMEGQCRIIKCLALMDEANNTDDYQGALLNEDEMLTAEFLDSMTTKRAGSRRRSVKSSRSVSIAADHGTKHKKQMLHSLGLNYINNDEDKMIRSQRFENQNDFLSKNSEEKRVEEHRQRAQQGIITMTTLMRQKLAEAPDTVFVHIGALRANEVFDLAEILKPNKTETKSTLTLVSSGAKILRIKRERVRASLSADAMEHAKHIAVKNLYPSNKVLMRSYNEKTRWDKYKQKVLADVVGPCQHKVKRRDVMERVKETSLARARSHARDSRLISTLRRQHEPQVSLDDTTSGLALEEPILLDHDDFESRLMREVDEKLMGNFRRMSITNQGRGVRANSVVDAEPDSVTSSNQITSVSIQSITA